MLSRSTGDRPRAFEILRVCTPNPGRHRKVQCPWLRQTPSSPRQSRCSRSVPRCLLVPPLAFGMSAFVAPALVPSGGGSSHGGALSRCLAPPKSTGYGAPARRLSAPSMSATTDSDISIRLYGNNIKIVRRAFRQSLFALVVVVVPHTDFECVPDRYLDLFHAPLLLLTSSGVRFRQTPFANTLKRK